MMKRTVAYFSILLILLAAAYSANQWDKDESLLRKQSVATTAWLETQYKDASAWIANRNSQRNAVDLKSTQQAVDQMFTVVGFHTDSLLFWSNARVTPGKTQLRQLGSQTGKMVAQMAGGWYFISTENKGDHTESILIPLKYTYTNPEAAPLPAQAYQISPPGNSGVPVLFEGKPVCQIAGPEQSTPLAADWIKLVCTLLAFVFALMLVFHLAGSLGKAPGLAVALSGIAGLLAYNYFSGFATSFLGDFDIFKPAFTEDIFPGQAVGDWLLAALAVTGFAVYFHHQFAGQDGGSKAASAALLSWISPVVPMVSTALLARSMSQIMRSSAQFFDPSDLIGMGACGLLSLAAVVVLAIGFFVISHRLVALHRRFSGAAHPIPVAGLALGAALTAVTAFLLLPSALDAVLAIAFAVIYYLLLYYFERWESRGLEWLVVWLVLFSLLGAVFFYRSFEDRANHTRRAYASALLEERDPQFAEPLLLKLLDKADVLRNTLGTSLKPWPFKTPSADLFAILTGSMGGNTYLQQHYRLQAFAFDQENQSILLEQSLPHAEFLSRYWEKGQPVGGQDLLRFVSTPDGAGRYLLKFTASRQGDAAQPAVIYFSFEHFFAAPTRLYETVFVQQPYKGMNLATFDFAVTKNGRLMVEQGQAAGALQHATEKAIADQEFNDRVFTVARDAEKQVNTAVGQQSFGNFKPLYLFSTLFLLCALLVSLLAALNNIFRFFPETYGFQLSTKGSLARRIHFWNVLLIALSFLVIGYMTYRHFSNNAQEIDRKNAQYRADALFTGVRQRILELDSANYARPVAEALKQIATSLSVDAQYYDAEGRLQYATRTDLADVGLLASALNPLAQQTMRITGGAVVFEEQVSGLGYLTRYQPLRNKANQIIGYLGAPSALERKKTGPEASQFIGMLASLYVFLLLIAFAITLLLANSIIKPVRMLSDKVRQLRFDDKNEPLQYAGDAEDEISELIGQYNRMVDKLEDSKVQLVRLEREGAWREMARQVAHDIKNPLTTMKLSMQQLERVSSNPEQAAAYLRKAITRLIEQIDSLAQIASEFSMFANLDIRNKSDVHLNEVVESVHDLFSEQRNVDLALTLPKENLHILGDKNHLIRVFNNLVINAIQAIPSDRRGHIKVSLERADKIARVRISDNGGGIPPEIRDRVFEPNFTTKTSGSGLGLAICKKIIEAHDGDIRFETRDNEGTDFFVDIPVTGFTRH